MSRIPGSGRTLRCPFATTWLQQARLDSPACDSPSDLLTCSVSGPSEKRKQRKTPASVHSYQRRLSIGRQHPGLLTSTHA